jgi:sortase (surface protein transpeptidase)
MSRHRSPVGAWVIAIALVAVGCAGGSDQDVTGAEPAPVTPPTTSSDDLPTPSDDPDGHADEDRALNGEEDTGVEVPSELRSGSTEDILAAMLATDPSTLSPETHDQGSLPNGVDPERIVIPAIGVDAEVIDLGVQDDGTMEVPTDFAQTGWFQHGPRPGRVGPALIAGHVDDRDGPAVFFRLAELSPGDQIEVHGTNGDRVVFEVRELEQHPKDAFPTERVYAGTPGPELRLVTCGGAFDQDVRSYRDNIIVYAERVDV